MDSQLREFCLVDVNTGGPAAPRGLLPVRSAGGPANFGSCLFPSPKATKVKGNARRVANTRNKDFTQQHRTQQSEVHELLRASQTTTDPISTLGPASFLLTSGTASPIMV